jgi:hypothetical protein
MSLAPNAHHRRAADRPRRRLPVGPRSIVPKLGEPVRGQGCVAHGMLNIAVPEVLLDRARIDPLVGPNPNGIQLSSKPFATK